MDKAVYIGMLIGSFTTAFGAILGHALSVSRDKRNAFNESAKQFISAFWPEVEFLDRQFIVDRASVKATKRLCDVLFGAIGRHQKAVFMFRNHFGCINRYRFNKAWQKYCKGGSNIHYFTEEYPCGKVFQRHKSETKALKRINAVLKFAKPK